VNASILRIATSTLLLSIFSPITFAAEDLYTSIPVSGCHTKEDFQKYSDAMRNRDRNAFRELTRSGKCLTLQKGTRVRVIQHDKPLYSQIETVGGEVKQLWTVYLGK
jgi:hypothetical protein